MYGIKKFSVFLRGAKRSKIDSSKLDSSENLDIILRETTTPNLWRLQTTGNPIVLNTWQHVCLTQNGTACEVYVDGGVCGNFPFDIIKSVYKRIG